VAVGKALAVALRILRQFRHDPRTVFFMVVAPVIALALLYTIFGAPEYKPFILVVNVTKDFRTQLETTGAHVFRSSFPYGKAALEAAQADGMVDGSSSKQLDVYVEGSDPAKTAIVLSDVAKTQANLASRVQSRTPPAVALPGGTILDLGALLQLPPRQLRVAPEVHYIHGNSDLRQFDFYGPVFIGVFVFFFVFITSGISFVRERTYGTLDRLMATPIRRWQVVLGYTIGFGLFALLQATFVAWASIYWVGFPNFGAFWLVLVVAVSMALVSLTLGILVSEFADTELQVIQLLQIVVVPQILLSGMFDLSQTPAWMQTLSSLLPVSYGAAAMRAVMLRGASFADVLGDLEVLWGFLVAFFIADILALKKYRQL
jgi:ABC-2 type transport system permease protein